MHLVIIRMVAMMTVMVIMMCCVLWHCTGEKGTGSGTE